MSSPTIIGIVIVVAFVILCGTPFLRYTADDAIKIVAVFTGFFGLIFGAMGSYFFTRTEVATARSQLSVAQAQTAAAQNQVSTFQAQLKAVASNAVQAKATLTEAVDSKPRDFTVTALKSDPGYRAAVTKLDAAGAAGAWILKYPTTPYDGEMAEKRKPPDPPP